jgi:hypothetical protein
VLVGFNCRWTSGAGDPRLLFYLAMGNGVDGFSVVIVPADTPGITKVRPMTGIAIC